VWLWEWRGVAVDLYHGTDFIFSLFLSSDPYGHVYGLESGSGWHRRPTGEQNINNIIVYITNSNFNIGENILQAAEEWLKKEDLMAFHLRESIIKKYGSPASSIRPEGMLL
jgi:hypothetical protein